MCAICPKCKAKIDYLNHYQSGENHYEFSVSDNGETDYELQEFQPNGEVNDYECPECQEVLFTDEGEAIEFLEEEDELQQIVKEKIEIIKNERDYYWRRKQNAPEIKKQML